MRETPEHRGTWLCPTPFDRTRLLDMEARLKPARAVMYGALGVAFLISGPWMGWWPIFPLLALVAVYSVFSRRIPTSDKPEYMVAAICVMAQLCIGLGVVLTGGPRSPALLLLLLMIVTLPARFGTRGVWAGVAVTEFVMLACTLPVDPQAFIDAPQYFFAATAALIGLAACSDTLMRAEIEQRSESVLDPLTGLLNRKALNTHFEEIKRQAHYTGRTVSLVICDLDHFKAVNDEHGHQRGDAVLRGVAEALRANLRTFELVYRVGGEEFLILMPGVQSADAEMVAERVRSGVEGAQPADLAMTVSIGIAVAEGTAVDFEAMYEVADKALYEAKRDGRNRAVLAPVMEAPSSGVTALGAAARVAEGPSRVPSVPLAGPAPSPSPNR